MPDQPRPDDAARTVRVVGVDRAGVGRTGAPTAEATPHQIARELWEKRWKWATIHRDGALVGEVGNDLDGKRTWWGEGDA